MVEYVYNFDTDSLDITNTADDFSNDFLKLDQTIPQTVANGTPTINNGFSSNLETTTRTLFTNESIISVVTPTIGVNRLFLLSNGESNATSGFIAKGLGYYVTFTSGALSGQTFAVDGLMNSRRRIYFTTFPTGAVVGDTITLFQKPTSFYKKDAYVDNLVNFGKASLNNVAVTGAPALSSLVDIELTGELSTNASKYGLYTAVDPVALEGSTGNLVGGYFTSSIAAGTTNFSEIVGGHFSTGINFSSTYTGTVTNAIAGDFVLKNQKVGATCINNYLFKGDSNITTGATNIYGIYLGDINQGSTLNYAIYTNLGDVLFGDDVIIKNDNDKLFMGSAKDMSVTYTGTVGQIDTSLVAPSDLQIDCGTNKTLVLDESVWDDIQFNIESGRTSAANFPDWDETFTTNTGCYKFDVNDFIDLGTQEMKHDWKEATSIYPHVHVALDGANTSGGTQYAKFIIYIAYAKDGVAYTETNKEIEITIPNGTADLTHIFAQSTALSMTGLNIGTQLNVRLKRIAATAGTEYPNHIFATQVGIHYEIDTLGSRQIGTK